MTRLTRCRRPASRPPASPRSPPPVPAGKAATPFEFAPRLAGAPSCLASFEVAAIVGRCLHGDPMKGSDDRVRAMESHIELNLGDRCAGACQQGLGALNPPARPVAIWRLPERLFEGSQKMIWAQP